MEKSGKDKRVGVLCCCLSSKSAVKWLYLTKNSIKLIHKMNENEESSSYGLTMDRGLHHKPSVVSSVVTLLCSFFLPRA